MTRTKTDDVREAAERLLKYPATLTSPGRQNATWDMALLAAAWLREHPADEDEPVTDEWLESVGFTNDIDGCGRVWESGEGLVSLYVMIGLNCLVECASKDEAVFVPETETRGDVRRLCSALGINLKEAKGGE